ncbi:MAG: DegT/DnrJ/EryC1/StrS family aminotransferase [Bacteroidales bacterium]|nr:DegT/DnrJ/EryC1/StrS family aminotransferase [Bacteroidales bacterium]
MKVPFNDLSKLHSELKNEFQHTFESIIENSAFVGGKHVGEFESCFAKKLGVKHCIGVSSGTAALFASFKMLGFTFNDEIILPANTFFACAEAISLCGATPIFVDNDEYFNINVNKIEQKIITKTKAILAVHLYGQSANLSALQNLCTTYNLLLIEDCSQSHFSFYNKKILGTLGKAAIFSFYPGKNLGAFGDAGCVVTNDDELAHKLRLFRNHGEYQKSKHQLIGFNCRLDGIQAAILKIKLQYIDIWNEKRRVAAEYYIELLKDCKSIILPKIMPQNTHTFHLFVIKALKRDKLKDFLAENEIGTGIHYPIALPFLSVYSHLGAKEKDYPEAFKNQKMILSLPIYPDISRQQIRYVVDKIIEFYAED